MYACHHTLQAHLGFAGNNEDLSLLLCQQICTTQWMPVAADAALYYSCLHALHGNLNDAHL
jgi:hypothetical protein